MNPELLTQARRGHISHLSEPAEFTKLYDVLFSNLGISKSDLKDTFLKSPDTIADDVALMVERLDKSKNHFQAFAEILTSQGIFDENVLDISLGKSLRLCTGGGIETELWIRRPSR